MKKAYFVMVIGPHDHINEQKQNFWEEENLLNFLNYQVVRKIFQHKIAFDSSFYIGSGKLIEIIEQAADEKPFLIYLNAVLNPAIIFRVEQKFWQINPNIKVWDRVDLILNVFEKHAFSTEAKLQIELARLKHLGPRIYGLGKQMSQQYGVVGVRGGFGETVLEKMRRYIKERINQIEKKLKIIEERKTCLINKRKERQLLTIALVGYTNTGKTALFNLLTNKEKIASNKPFTTLETVVGIVKNVKWPLIISDTIGFIDNLPTFLIDSFKSTLLETINADLIFHMIDISDKNWQKKQLAVNKILNELGIDERKIIILFNKIDLLAEKIINNQFHKNYKQRNFYISAKTGLGIDNLLNFLNEYFSNSYFISS